MEYWRLFYIFLQPFWICQTHTLGMAAAAVGAFSPTRVMGFPCPPEGRTKWFLHRMFSQPLEQVSVFVGNIRKFLPAPPPRRVPPAGPSGHMGVAYATQRNDRHKLGTLKGWRDIFRGHQVPGREPLHLQGLPRACSRGRTLPGSLKLLASFSRSL